MFGIVDRNTNIYKWCHNFFVVTKICDVVAKFQSDDKISKCNQHFLVASKSQGVDKTCLWCQSSKVVPNCQSGTFGGSNILEPGSNILEPQNFIFNILEGNEEKKL